MPLGARFYKAVESLYFARMGTEHVAPLLYSLICMTRPRRLLEVGLGYMTPFMAQALKDNLEELQVDRDVLHAPEKNKDRRSVLAPEYYKVDYTPKLHGIDSHPQPEVLKAIEALGLESLVQVDKRDFRGASQQMDVSTFPLDFVWFDCGGLREYIDFIEEYWRLINPERGILLLYFTYWNLPLEHDGVNDVRVVCGSVANELKRQQMAAGVNANFKVLSLLEPHKTDQGSVTMIRKLPWTSKCRDRDFQEEVFEIFDTRFDPLIKL